MTLIAFSDGKAVMRGDKIGTETACCCGGTSCNCPSTVNIGSNSVTLTFSVSIFGEPWGTCDRCESEAFGAVLHRFGNPCRYYGDYSLTSCIGAAVEVRVYFDLGNFPDCECGTTGDYCDYTITGWAKTFGAASVTITDVTPGDFC
jgi:hypothetical protein